MQALHNVTVLLILAISRLRSVFSRRPCGRSVKERWLIPRPQRTPRCSLWALRDPIILQNDIRFHLQVGHTRGEAWRRVASRRCGCTVDVRRVKLCVIELRFGEESGARARVGGWDRLIGLESVGRLQPWTKSRDCRKSLLARRYVAFHTPQSTDSTLDRPHTPMMHCTRTHTKRMLCSCRVEPCAFDSSQRDS